MPERTRTCSVPGRAVIKLVLVHELLAAVTDVSGLPSPPPPRLHPHPESDRRCLAAEVRHHLRLLTCGLSRRGPGE